MAAKERVKHGAAPVFAIAFPVLRPAHVRIPAIIVLVKETAKTMIMIMMTILMMIPMMIKMTANSGFVDASSIRYLVDIFPPVCFQSLHVYKECDLSITFHCPFMEAKEICIFKARRERKT